MDGLRKFFFIIQTNRHNGPASRPRAGERRQRAHAAVGVVGGWPRQGPMDAAGALARGVRGGARRAGGRHTLVRGVGPSVERDAGTGLGGSRVVPPAARARGGVVAGRQPGRVGGAVGCCC
jgi:hypothetical protein